MLRYRSSACCHCPSFQVQYTATATGADYQVRVSVRLGKSLELISGATFDVTVYAAAGPAAAAQSVLLDANGAELATGQPVVTGGEVNVPVVLYLQLRDANGGHPPPPPPPSSLYPDCMLLLLLLLFLLTPRQKLQKTYFKTTRHFLSPLYAGP